MKKKRTKSERIELSKRRQGKPLTKEQRFKIGQEKFAPTAEEFFKTHTIRPPTEAEKKLFAAEDAAKRKMKGNSMMEIRRPMVCRDGAEAANALAQERGEPILCPVSLYADDRGWSMMNQLQGILGPGGQVNFSCQYPGVIKGWHRHKKQTDFWMCVQGHVKAGVWREGEDWAWMTVLGEKAPGVWIIPPGLWHGAATVGPTSAGLLYYVTHAYDAAAPDEERRAHDSVDGFPWTVRHG